MSTQVATSRHRGWKFIHTIKIRNSNMMTRPIPLIQPLLRITIDIKDISDPLMRPWTCSSFCEGRYGSTYTSY